MKKVTQRGRTLEAVLTPRNFAPFNNLTLTAAAFEQAWHNNPYWLCAHISHAAYHNKIYLTSLFNQLGADISFYQSKPDNYGFIMGRQAFMATWPDKAILAFRGTEIDEQLEINVNQQNRWLRWLRRKWPFLFHIPFIAPDIIDDINAIPMTHKEGDISAKIHQGFYQATQELWPAIIADIERVKAQNKPLYVTGHSLGGAMALITAAKINVTQVITFGMPATGKGLDKVIPKDCEHMRFVNGNDPVTKIIPKKLYPHHGTEVKIQDISGSKWYYDHSIINYAEILTN